VVALLPPTYCGVAVEATAIAAAARRVGIFLIDHG
jgi:hypothetical protein